MPALLEKIMAAYPGSSLERMSAEAADGIRDQHPGVPDDYLFVLQNVGYGTIGRAALALYGGPVSAASVFGEAVVAQSLVLVGDDMAGYHLGYLTDEQPWTFIEFDHCDNAAPSSTASLSAWLTRFVADGTR